MGSGLGKHYRTHLRPVVIRRVVAKLHLPQIGYSFVLSLRNWLLANLNVSFIYGNMEEFRKTFHKTWEHADDLPISTCISGCLNKQIIIPILIFYSILPLLDSLKQRIIIRSKITSKKLWFSLSFWQNSHWFWGKRDLLFFHSAYLNPCKTEVFKFCTRTHLGLSSLL